MNTVLGVLCLVCLGNVCLSKDTSDESAQSVEEDSRSVDNVEVSLFAQILNSTAEDESTNNSTSDNSLSVDKKCFFFWPWLNWLLDCTQRICIARGAYFYVPVCGVDSSLGYRTFKNRCYLNASNTCYSTSYTLNSSAECLV